MLRYKLLTFLDDNGEDGIYSIYDKTRCRVVQEYTDYFAAENAVNILNKVYETETEDALEELNFDEL